jgi:aspartate racemase
MRTLGLLGGMSWESTSLYYTGLNRGVRERKGGAHSAPLLIWSADFAPIADMQAEDRWDDLGALLANRARGLEAAGAEALLICANTMHKVAPEVEAAVGVPVLHVADAVAAALRDIGCRRPALMATRYTMEHDFYRERLRRHGVEAVIPDPAERDELHRIIFDELILGVVSEASRDRFVGVAERLAREAGADSVILGCTEFALLVDPGRIPVPAVDSTALHIAAGLEFIIG